LVVVGSVVVGSVKVFQEELVVVAMVGSVVVGSVVVVAVMVFQEELVVVEHDTTHLAGHR
jgi:predicted membrane protein